jgi:hypothetical protein
MPESMACQPIPVGAPSNSPINEAYLPASEAMALADRAQPIAGLAVLPSAGKMTGHHQGPNSEPTANEPVDAAATALRWLAWGLLAASLGVVLFVRVRLLPFPLERDEGEYAYAGQLLLDGIPPYKLAYNMKMPGTYLAYAAIMAAFGQTPQGIHLGLLAVHVGSLLLLFLIARKLFGLSGAGLATSAYALMGLSPSYFGLAAHATHFVLLPALMGIWLLLRFDGDRRVRLCFASGCCFGIAFLMKQPGMFFGFFGGLYLAWLCYRERPLRTSSTAQRVRNLSLRLGSFSVGCVLPFLAVCAWLKVAGVFPQFWFWTITYARQYAAILTLAQGWSYYLRDNLLRIFLAAVLLWIGVLTGMGVLCFVRMEKDRRVFLAGFVVFSLLAVCPGFYFRNHYFILLLPAAALLIGLAVSWGEKWFEPTPWWKLLPLLIGVLACAESLLAYHNVLFSLAPVEACRAVYPQRSFAEAVDVGRYLRHNTQPTERIAIIGSEPEIYFYAHRLSSSGYIYMYPFMEPQPFAQHMQANMIREIEQNPPAYLVVVAVPDSLCSIHYWDSATGPRQRLLAWVGSYVADNMEPVGLLQIDEDEAHAAARRTQAAAAPLDSSLYISVFKRKSSR